MRYFKLVLMLLKLEARPLHTALHSLHRESARAVADAWFTRWVPHTHTHTHTHTNTHTHTHTLSLSLSHIHPFLILCSICLSAPYSYVGHGDVDSCMADTLSGHCRRSLWDAYLIF
jgi:hypothetical protein